ncbi:hypothetical protein B0A48_13774 [Cryoendolithus antarcticus]|uniref:PhoD-like phosphatase domain-containing protein n=1 Tax=Cryoendolithus antarcticus TaxID=1507870 RepID=A0A1V8SMM9_9PEZI|nr:hypothetical protein B0A48_13774 [Cryoendolithus antarcticus]
MEDNRRQSGLFQQNGQGFYERSAPEGPYKYYEPPAPRASSDVRRSFSERTADPASHHAPQRSVSKRQQPETYAPQRPANEYSMMKSEMLSRTEVSNRNSAAKQPLRIDPNAAPANLRTEAWSPDAMSPDTGRDARHASNASERLRRGSVPDKSPLQKLEYKFDDISKEEKRAKAQQAERRALEKLGKGHGEVARSGTVSSGKVRVVSDGSRRPAQPIERVRDDRQRHASAGASRDEQVEAGAAKFRRASDALRNSPPKQNGPVAGLPAQDRSLSESRARDGGEQRTTRQPPTVVAPTNGQDGGLERTASGKYRHRARDAGFAGAAAAFAGGTAAERGKAAYERRKAQSNDSPVSSPISPVAREQYGSLGRNESKKLQKPRSVSAEQYGRQQPVQFASHDGTRGSGQTNGSTDVRRETSVREDKGLLHNDRMGRGAGDGRKAAAKFQDRDIVPPERVKTGKDEPVPYSIPPQTAAGRSASEQVGFGAATAQGQPHVQSKEEQHRFRDFLHHHHGDRRGYVPNNVPLEEWRTASTAKLLVADLDLDDATSAPTPMQAENRDPAWWEKQQNNHKANIGVKTASSQYEGAFEEESQSFKPALFLKCGPLLRYTGLRTESGARGGRREVWRGSVMIVTEDASSEYATPPVLRMFAQPSDLHQSPPSHLMEVPPEDEDPVAGQVKVSRTGRPLYVRPAHDLEAHVDLSREENNHGLYSAVRTPMLGPQSMTSHDGDDGGLRRRVTFQDKSRIKRRDGEKLSKYREVKAHRLLTERGVTFWRFNLEIELRNVQTRIAYRINRGPALGFWVPAASESMNIMFHSCNGFSMTVNADDFSGPDPLWRDVLNRHQHRPFHVMLGGGDQIYNDAAMRDTTLFRDWLQIKNLEHKHSTDFSVEMQEELESFYLNRYCMWFSQGLFSMANSQIPMVNLWDDHDIIDGFGSYPHHFMSSRVFTGVGAVAFKYYMLFQHQSVPAETAKEEPSWLLGAHPGPYIAELSRHIFTYLGANIAFLGLDCRTERMRDEILSQETYDIVFSRLRQELVKGRTKHLLVLLGVPIAYPRLNFLENILTSKVMDPIKALGRTGLLGGFVNKFDGGVEILDDLDDHWTAKHHKAERNWFIQELQALAAEKSIRVTILGGDVHLAAVGQFYSNAKLGIAKDKDWRYMPNIISSAIVNTPPPPMMADVLNKRNKIHHLDHETDEDCIPMFDHDVDGSKRNNTHLLPRRNFCTIRDYKPGTTPPGSPRLEPEDSRQFPPGSMRRTMSLTGRSATGMNKLVRRFSGSAAQGQRSANPPLSMANTGSHQRSNSMSSDPAPRPGLYRRPTNMSVKAARKAAAKGGADGNLDGREMGEISLDGGLDVNLCVEVDQTDPRGRTERYRLLVPALFVEDGPQLDEYQQKLEKGGLFSRLSRRRGPKNNADDYSDDGHSSEGETPLGEAGRGKELEALGVTAAGGAAAASAAHHHPEGGEPGVQRQASTASSSYRRRMAPQPNLERYSEAATGGYFDHAPPTSAGAERTSYDRGYDLAQPPVGANAQPQLQHHEASSGNAMDYDNYNVSGKPGTGKSTLLQHHGPPPQVDRNPHPYPSQNQGAMQQKPPNKFTSLFRRLSAPRPNDHGDGPPPRSPSRSGSEGSYTDYTSEGSYSRSPSPAQAPGAPSGPAAKAGQGRFEGVSAEDQVGRRGGGMSKAERFLGLSGGSGAVGGGGGEGRKLGLREEGGRAEWEDGEGNGYGEKKKGWKIWK